MDVDFEVPTWDTIYSLLLRQARKLRISGLKADYIVAIARGGWLPARVLSDLLGNNSLATVTAESQTDIGGGIGEPILTQSVSVDVKGKCLLLIDDVADTGKSLKLVFDHLNDNGAKSVCTSTLYYKPWSIFKPEYFELETTKWVVFPWEIRETLKKLFNRYGKSIHFEKEIEKLVNGGMSRPIIDKILNEFIDDSKC